MSNMKHPFKRVNPDLKPPEHLEKRVFQRLSLVRLLMNFTSVFTTDMVKTGMDTMEGLGDRNDHKHRNDESEMESDGAEPKK